MWNNFFTKSLIAGSDVLFRNENGDLILYDIDTDSTMPLIYNTSEVSSLYIHFIV